MCHLWGNIPGKGIDFQIFMLNFKWILRVKLRNERGIKLPAAAYFPLKCHMKWVKCPENGKSKWDFSSSSWLSLLHHSPCSLCPHRDQIEDVEVKCSSCCAVFLHPDVGTEPRISHCTNKSSLQLQDPCSSGGCLLPTFLPQKETSDSQLGEKELQR